MCAPIVIQCGIVAELQASDDCTIAIIDLRRLPCPTLPTKPPAPAAPPPAAAAAAPARAKRGGAAAVAGAMRWAARAAAERHLGGGEPGRGRRFVDAIEERANGPYVRLSGHKARVETVVTTECMVRARPLWFLSRYLLLGLIRLSAGALTTPFDYGISRRPGSNKYRSTPTALRCSSKKNVVWECNRHAPLRGKSKRVLLCTSQTRRRSVAFQLCGSQR